LPDKPTYILRDYDAKFGKEFDAVFKAEHHREKGRPGRAEHERDRRAVVQTLRNGRAMDSLLHKRTSVSDMRQKCLDHFIAFGEDDLLRYILREYEMHYNEERPHQALGNEPLKKSEAASEGEVVCSERLGGLLKHYHRKAA
jgi:hypothetical protein